MDYWTIKFTRSAEKQLKKIDLPTRKLIQDYINTKILNSNNPKSKEKALTGNKKGLWRYRVSKYRIICKIENEILTVLVLNIVKRDCVYKNY